MIVKQKLDSIVYDLLIESFYNEEYTAGQVLVPGDIAEKYNISKTPVLQALKRLENEKILQVSNSGKYTLVCPNADNIRDICDIRYLFEKSAAEYLISKITEVDYERLLDFAKACRKIDAGSKAKEILKADYAFHRYMVSLQGNSIINEFFESVINRYILLKYASGYKNELEGLLEKSYQTHTTIATLIREGKREELFAYLQDHIYFVRGD